MRDVFNNSTLASMMNAMWSHVAEHYAGWDNIAAYEILSEPRDKDATAEQVRDFYSGGCASTQATDPRTPCMASGVAGVYRAARRRTLDFSSLSRSI